ncbi:MAG: hypothetical protein Q7P63_17280 [Verrucomicrobiota bacterium JB022]|nr:hypothetical protein [Verrucomicrobiota bacterium JB022]
MKSSWITLFLALSLAIRSGYAAVETALVYVGTESGSVGFYTFRFIQGQDPVLIDSRQTGYETPSVPTGFSIAGNGDLLVTDRPTSSFVRYDSDRYHPNFIERVTDRISSGRADDIIAFGNRAYVLNGGLLSMFEYQAGSMAFVENFTIQTGLSSLTISPSGQLYATHTRRDELYIYDFMPDGSPKLDRSILYHNIDGPSSVDFNPITGTIYIAATGSNAIFALPKGQDTVRFSGIQSPTEISFLPWGDLLVNHKHASVADQLTILDPLTGKRKTITVPGGRQITSIFVVYDNAQIPEPSSILLPFFAALFIIISRHIKQH